jgi:hypothetical protein
MTTVEIVFLVFGLLALAGIFVALTDKSLKWKGRK